MVPKGTGSMDGRSRWCLVAAVVAALATGCAPEKPAAPATGVDEAVAPAPTVEARDLDRFTSARLQAISVVDPDHFWVSGLEGTWGRTEDGGASWVSGRIAGAEELQLRDVHAFAGGVAYALSAGEGDASRIFRTDDGGATWRHQWTMPEAEGFLDCFDFWSEERGIAYGDSVGGGLYVLTTVDGESWSRVPPENLPEPAGSEGGFAASGTCVRVAGETEAWIGTGAGDRPRVLRSVDAGASWTAADLPTVAGSAAGVMSIVLGPGGLAGALGGDLEQPDVTTSNVAWTRDAGATWRLGELPGFPGAVYGADLAMVDGQPWVAAVGPAGIALAAGLDRWTTASREEYWAVAFVGERAFVAVGPEGRMTRFDG